MEDNPITSDLIIADVMQRWPVSILVFLENRMACVGCSMSAFDTLADALEVYDIPQEEILATLNLRADPNPQS